MNVKISIIIATYNRAHFILETLNSIQNQSYPNFECLIIDDGSIDKTKEILQGFLKDSRFSYLKRPNTYFKGLSGARNYGLDIAKGSFIIFFDDDDVVHPLNLEISIEQFKDYPDIDFCHYMKQSFTGRFEETFRDISSKPKRAPNNFLELQVTQKKLMASCTVLWRQSCFDNQRFNEQLEYAEDWECYTRILSQCSSGVILDDVLYFHRKHSNSNTGEFWKHDLNKMQSMQKAIYLIVDYLSKRELLNDKMRNYLIALSIGYRDEDSFKLLISNSKIDVIKIIIYKLRYLFYPLWKIYKRFFKELD
jgi:GalNAc5-diNAcBac-PP-undecaprenol beta-1,3-glucosyltransferase